MSDMIKDFSMIKYSYDPSDYRFEDLINARMGINMVTLFNILDFNIIFGGYGARGNLAHI